MDDTRPDQHQHREELPLMRALLQLGSVQRTHGEKLDAILELLQPAAGAQEGPSLEEMLQAIITRLDTQADYLRRIAEEVGRQGEELPADVAAAIAAAGAGGAGIVLPHGRDRAG